MTWICAPLETTSEQTLLCSPTGTYRCQRGPFLARWTVAGEPIIQQTKRKCNEYILRKASVFVLRVSVFQNEPFAQLGASIQLGDANPPDAYARVSASSHAAFSDCHVYSHE
ncbi:unnamed protein product [Fusarium graminearum]|nr:unnamed protein product [Fusarium graminearum]